MRPIKPILKFSEHFGLNKKQSQLDFVDIPMDTDVALYVDPYALSVSTSDWLRDAGDVVVGYFDLLLKTIRSKDESKAKWILSNLHEPNDTHLGVSKGKPRGRGWDEKQINHLYRRLSKSRAVQSGLLKDLTDFELLIPGIGDDKVSDLTTNIIRGELVAYTEEQCMLLDIPTENVNSGFYWDHVDHSWTSRYANLPVYDDKSIVLVPKVAVRFRLVPDYSQYYRRFVLEYLQSEHLHAGGSLVRLLKNGKTRVYKKDLMKTNPLTKDYLFNFSEKHPDVLKAYKKSLRTQSKPLSSEQFREEDRLQPSDVAARQQQLAGIQPGRDQANDYHNFVLDLFNEVFYPALTRPVKEQSIDEGRKRVDIMYTNSAETGFFSNLVNMHKVHAPYITVECKNYTEDLGNAEIDQMIGRFSRKRGRFGIIVCRDIQDRDLLLRRLKDIVNNSDNAVVVLEDTDLINLLTLKAKGDEKGVSESLEDKLRSVLL